MDFVLYMLALQVSLILAITLSLHSFIAKVEDQKMTEEGEEASYSHFALPVLCVVLLIILALLIALLVVHIYLITGNQSTYEFLMGAWKEKMNPMNSGSFASNLRLRITKWR